MTGNTQAESEKTVAADRRWGMGRSQHLLLAVLAFQYALLAGALYVFRLESSGFLRLVALGGVGFVVHHLLPMRWRLPFFAALSLVGIAVVVTPRNAVWLIGCGLVLIGLCHVPVRFELRVTLVALAAVRAGLVTGPWPHALWPLLGSMFMFRLVVYLYDLRNKSAPFSVSRALAYFFMLPNVSFPLFPVVDYQTFCRTHYNDEPFRIYQKGANWFLRGIVHLLAYRWVYQNLAVDPAGITDAAGVARYMLGAFLLYLKVSGTFHLIVGMLHFFGFNLPETHHRYLLATSFTDFWRRINIYWKDFIQKIVFYPVYFRLKGRGQTAALAAATAVAFLATWLLHSYQTFWIVGPFPLRAVDFVFWSALGCGVLVNVLREAGAPRRQGYAVRHTVRAGPGLADDRDVRLHRHFVVVVERGVIRAVVGVDAELPGRHPRQRRGNRGMLGCDRGGRGVGFDARPDGDRAANRFGPAAFVSAIRNGNCVAGRLAADRGHESGVARFRAGPG